MSSNQEYINLNGSNTDQDKGTQRQRWNIFTRRNQPPTSLTEFEGKSTKMNDHIFVYHEATTVPTQYIDTMERLGSYASRTYKYINLMV